MHSSEEWAWGAVNDALRSVIGVSLRTGGAVLELGHRRQIRVFDRSQARLRQRYQIETDTPITMTVPPIDAASATQAAGPGKTRIAETSGSSGQPKQVLYSKQRVRRVQHTFVEAFLRGYWVLDVRRTSLYVFGPLAADRSLSALLLEEERTPSWPKLLQAPYRAQSHPALQELAATYGPIALRLWVLTLANPGMLYATNPSTLSTFFDALARDWNLSTALVRDSLLHPERLPAGTDRIVRRLVSRGSRKRLERIAESAERNVALPISAWAPAVHAYSCWTGGYVAPFLERLETHLPPARYRRIPMYSMSTETVETISHFEADSVRFLPLAPGVLYEFLEEGAEARPKTLVPAGQLARGGAYQMVVSHAYGLRRYATGDIFTVAGFVEGEGAGVPDLRFLRRSGLAYSFTGEKLTGEQLAEAYARLANQFPQLGRETLVTCFPSQPEDEPLPHYRLILVCDRDTPSDFPGIAEALDAQLGELNREYRSKRESQRLGPVRTEAVSLADFRDRVSRATGSGWDSQLKFLPLYPYLWEAAGAKAE